MLNGKSVLVTGGTGSFGKAFVRIAIERYPDIRRLVVFSRDELKQFEMAQEFPQTRTGPMRYFIGDVRDSERLRRAFEDVDIVIHAAALKQVPAAEYNPGEFIHTNIAGAENVINAALENGVCKVIALSTDKAAAPINLYGASKLCSDKLFVAANNIRGKRDITFCVVRYGNVMGSRGSVIPFFLKKRKEGYLPITDPYMTRFNILLSEGVEMVLAAISVGLGGEIFVPKIPSYRIMDLALAIGPYCDYPTVGIRPGEKIHEEMITDSDAITTVDLGDYFAILPSSAHIDTITEYMQKTNAKAVPEGFNYSSVKNEQWLSVEDIRQLITEHVDPSFSV